MADPIKFQAQEIFNRVFDELRDLLKTASKIVGVDGTTTASVEPRTQTPTGNALNVQIGAGDPISNIPVVMDFPHHQIHEGETYMWHFYGAVNNTSKDVRISVPNLVATTRTPHLLFEVISSGTALIYLYEGTTFTAVGTQDTAVHNRNRNSTNAAATKIYISGATALTPNVLGTEIGIGYLIASARASNNAERGAHEWDLKTSTEYLLRVTTSDVANVLIRLIWYEDLGV